MSVLQERAVQMINGLSDDNVRVLIDFMQRFMLSKGKMENPVQTMEKASIMQEMETMRKKAKAYFPADFDSQEVWEEAMDEKYGDFD